MQNPLPRRSIRQLRRLLIISIPINDSASRINIDILDAQPLAALPDIADDVEEDDDGQSEIRDEESFCV